MTALFNTVSESSEWILLDALYVKVIVLQLRFFLELKCIALKAFNDSI